MMVIVKCCDVWQCVASKGDYADAVSVLQTAMKIDPNSRVCESTAVTVLICTALLYAAVVKYADWFEILP